MDAFFLTEGGKNKGFGHISRCFALSQALTESNIKSHFFFSADELANSFFKKIKVKFSNINWFENPPEINNALVFIDSYEADNKIYEKYKENNLTVAIDDYKRIDYQADVIVCPAVYGKEIYPEKKEDIIYLLGKDYIILRKEFWTVPEKKINKNAKSVLVVLGGLNDINFTLKLIKIIQELDLEIHLIVTDKKNIANYKKVDKGLFIYNNLSASEILNLMLKCDIAVSAGGQTLYELARVGTPTIGICVAENQQLNLKYLEKYKFLNNAGWYNNDNHFLIIKEYLINLNCYEKRKKINDICKTIFYGKGAKRIIDKVFSIY